MIRRRWQILCGPKCFLQHRVFNNLTRELSNVRLALPPSLSLSPATNSCSRRRQEAISERVNAASVMAWFGFWWGGAAGLPTQRTRGTFETT